MKTAVKTLSVTLIGLLLVLAPVEIVWIPAQAAIPFPYKTLGDAAVYVTDMTPGSCQGEEGALMAAEIPSKYLILYIGNGKILAGEWTILFEYALKPPQYIWIGTVDKDGTITMTSREPYDPGTHGTGPCRLLYPERYSRTTI